MTKGPTAYLICGSTGAGKTTYACQLATQTQGIRLSVDPWMQGLFGPDWPDPLTYAWALERVERLEDHSLELCKQLIPLGLDVIFDFGFFKQAQRQKITSAAQALGAQVELHYLDVSAPTRWERVQQRNQEQGETYALQVTQGMFDFCETLFEAPDPDEATLIHTKL